MRAVLKGELTLDQTQKIFALINVQGETIALVNLQGRLTEMENILKNRLKKK